jgi:hypothetical protein
VKLSRIVPLLIIVALVSYLAGQCNMPWRYHSERLERNSIADLPHNELKRVTSPDGAVDAILARVETDSLSADGFAVYLASSGKELDLQSLNFDRKVFYANRIDDLELVWREPKFLEIRYSRGDIFDFRNNWWLRSDYIVEIRIVPKSEPFSLSK